MKKLFIIVCFLLFAGCVDVKITPNAKINESFFSSAQERQAFDRGIIKGDLNKIFNACFNVLQAEGYPVKTQNKSGGVIKGGPKSTENGLYYVKCNISEVSKEAYALKWSFAIDAGAGVVIEPEENSDAKRMDTFSQEWNYPVFCQLKGYTYK